MVNMLLGLAVGALVTVLVIAMYLLLLPRR